MEQQQRNSRGCLLAMAEAEVAAQPAAARAAEQEAEDESSPDDELSLFEKQGHVDNSVRQTEESNNL